MDLVQLDLRLAKGNGHRMDSQEHLARLSTRGKHLQEDYMILLAAPNNRTHP